MATMTFPDQVRVPHELIGIIRTLEDAGHESWCVGGAIRDALLGLDGEAVDYDVATAAHPDAVQALFRHTVAVGLRYGTVGVLDKDRVLHEVTTFRHDVTTDGNGDGLLSAAEIAAARAERGDRRGDRRRRRGGADRGSTVFFFPLRRHPPRASRFASANCMGRIRCLISRPSRSPSSCLPRCWPALP